MKQLNWYQIFGKSNIPDGRTVEPTDDIQIWLHCANIWDKPYTTLGEVLTDTDTLLALITSNNAVDYMVRSTTWAVSSALVPVMTSNTTPSGVCFGSGTESGDYYLSFDGNDSSTPYLNPRSPSKSYVGYMFNEAVAISKVHLRTRSDKIGHHKIQGSEDGLTWEDLTADTATNSSNYIIDFDIDYSRKYKYIRDYGGCDNSNYANFVYTLQFYSPSVPDNATAMTYIGQNNYCANTLLADATWCNAIANSTYFESVLNVKVPFMTSATAPEGEAFGTTAGTYYPWKAFNGTNSSAVDMWYAGIPSTIGYKFTRTVKVVRADITGRNTDNAHMYSVRNFVVQGSNDDFVSDVNDLGSFTNTDNSPRSFHNYIFANDTEYQSYRLSVSSCNKPSSGDYDSCAIGMLQFYGREDV